MNFNKRCSHCNGEYEYEGFANLIAFCPHCRKYDFLECEYGYGPVVPCRIYLGHKEVAMISYEDREQRKYRYDSTIFGVHKELKRTYFEALEEARELTAELLVFMES